MHSPGLQKVAVGPEVSHQFCHPKRIPKLGNTIGMYISSGKYKELRAIFDRLAAGADNELLDDLWDVPFGSYGHLADKYGVHWFFRGEKKE